MLYLKDTGIIITKKPHKEKDALVIILTKKYGKVRALATGLRKQESRILGLSEPGTIAKFYFAVSSSKSIVSSNIIRLLSILGWKLPGNGFKKHPYLYLWALRFLSAANILEISDELWNLILGLDKKILKEPRGFQIWFILKVLEELGESPNFEHCNNCGRLLIIFPRSPRSARSSGEPPLISQPCDSAFGGDQARKAYEACPRKDYSLNNIFLHRSSFYCSNCRKPSYESISQKDLFLMQKISKSNDPIFPYPPQLKKIISDYLNTKK